MLRGSPPSVARSPLSPGVTEPADLGWEIPGTHRAEWEREKMGSIFHSGVLDSGPIQSCPSLSSSLSLCRKLIFQELLEVSWGSGSTCWNKQADASHHFIKTPLHIHKAQASGLGNHELQRDPILKGGGVNEYKLKDLTPHGWSECVHRSR